MGEEVLKNCKYYFKGQDLSGDMNSLTLTNSVELVENTAFGSNSRRRKPGLRDLEVTAAGYWNVSSEKKGGSTLFESPDDVMFNSIGGTSEVLSVCPKGTELGGPAYFAKAIAGEYSPSGSVGEMLGFNFVAHGEGDLIRGKVMHAGYLTSENDENIYSFGSQSTMKDMYAAVHIMPASTTVGGALVRLKVQRSTTTTFAGINSTILAFTLTTAHMGSALWGTTKVHSSGSFSYRVSASQLGSSEKQFKLMFVLGEREV